MDPDEIRELILRELPGLIREDSEIREWVWRLIHGDIPKQPAAENSSERPPSEPIQKNG